MPTILKESNDILERLNSNKDFLFIRYLTFETNKHLSTFRRIFSNKNTLFNFFVEFFKTTPKSKLKFSFANKQPSLAVNLKPKLF